MKINHWEENKFGHECVGIDDKDDGIINQHRMVYENFIFRSELLPPWMTISTRITFG